MGNLVLTGATSGSATVQATDAQTVTITLPSSTGTLASTGANTFTADQTINGLTVGKGGGSVAYNTALGFNAILSNTTGTGLTAVGTNALAFNTTGAANTAIGGYDSSTLIQGALQLNTTGSYNSAVGVGALKNNTTGNNNSALGFSALISNTTASNNTAVGYQAGYSNTTSQRVVAVGASAGYSNTTGRFNNSFGSEALYSVTTGERNNAFGYRALYTNTGENNTAIGDQALLSNTTANNNTAVGYQANYANTTGANNVAIGFYSLRDSTAGANNVCVGYYAGEYNAGVQGSYNVLLGSNAGVNGTGDNYCIVVGANNSVGKGSSTGFINPNGGGVYQGNNSASWSTTSDQRLKKNIVDNTVGLSAITAIQVRNFEYRTADEVTELEPQNAIDIKGVQLGVIAQELKAILPECVKEESTGVMSVDTTNLTWYLINAVKELNTKVTALEAQLGAK